MSDRRSEPIPILCLVNHAHPTQTQLIGRSNRGEAEDVHRGNIIDVEDLGLAGSRRDTILRVVL